MTLAIIGSRSFTDYDLVCETVDQLFPAVSAIVSGGARGADALARRLADERQIPIQEYLPDWKRHGRGAGMIRNRDIISAADAVLAFWHGTSRGTKGGIDYARKMGRPVTVVEVGQA